MLPTAADVEKFFGAARQDLKERGYSHSKLLEVHVRLLGTDCGARQFPFHKIQN